MEGRCSRGIRSFIYRAGQKYYSKVMQLKSLEMTPFTAGYEGNTGIGMGKLLVCYKNVPNYCQLSLLVVVSGYNCNLVAVLLPIPVSDQSYISFIFRGSIAVCLDDGTGCVLV